MLALVTDRLRPGLTDDDRPLLAALADLDPRPVAWDDSTVDWAAFAAVIIRSPWDYQFSFPAFEAWIERLRAVNARVWNPVDLLSWNLRKTYLAELEARGVPIVPTAWVHEPTPLAPLLAAHGWDEAVIKPIVGAAGHDTWRVRVGDDRLVPSGFMVQPFVREFTTDGEWSFVFFDGEYSHAAFKQAGPGQFLIHIEYGGTVAIREPSADLVAQATAVCAAVHGDPLYIRVDGVSTPAGLLVNEVELVEPEIGRAHV